MPSCRETMMLTHPATNTDEQDPGWEGRKRHEHQGWDQDLNQASKSSPHHPRKLHPGSALRPGIPHWQSFTLSPAGPHIHLCCRLGQEGPRVCDPFLNITQMLDNVRVADTNQEKSKMSQLWLRLWVSPQLPSEIPQKEFQGCVDPPTTRLWELPVDINSKFRCTPNQEH